MIIYAFKSETLVNYVLQYWLNSSEKLKILNNV